MAGEWRKRGLQFTQSNEGFSPDVYPDTEGNPTIGYGFNLNAYPNMPRKMTLEEARALMEPIYDEAASKARGYATDDIFSSLNDNQKIALTDMAYNMNNKLDTFKDMKSALLAREYEKVKNEMIDSKWYGQVKSRGPKVTSMWSSEQIGG